MKPPKTIASPVKPKQQLFRVIRLTLYWGLPPLILYLIFRRVDIGQLELLASNANLFFVVLAIAMLVPVVVLGAIRWLVLMRRYDSGSLSAATSIVEYWKSLAAGLIVPGSLGSDAYRVMLLGQKNGLYLRNAFVVGVEKLAALFACAVLIASLYPLLAPNHLPGAVAHLVDAIYLVFLAGILFFLSVFFVSRKNWGKRLIDAINARFAGMARRVASLSTRPPSQEEQTPRTSVALMMSAFSPVVALPAVGLSLAIYLVTAAQSQLLFHAFGYEIPFVVNLFITPLLFLLYALPISFGGIGIREGAFILAYSAFGVPAETSLVISFTGLLGNLISYAIGASLFLLSKRRQQTDDVPVVLNPSALNSKK